MLNNNIYETLRNVANRYNLQVKYSYDKDCYDHFLIEEEKSEFINICVEKIYKNKLYFDIASNYIHIEIYNDIKRLCNVEIHEEGKAMSVLKYINRHYKEYRNYCDFLYNLAITLRRISK